MQTNPLQTKIMIRGCPRQAAFGLILLLLVASSGCGMLRKPASWNLVSKQDVQGNSTPAGKSQPARIRDWTRELNNLVPPTENVGEQAAVRQGLTLDSIQLANNDRPSPNGLPDIDERIIGDRQLPKILDAGLNESDEAKLAQSSVNQLIGDVPQAVETRQASQPSTIERPIPPVSYSPNSDGESRRSSVAESSNTKLVAETLPGSNQEATNRASEIISIKAVPAHASNSDSNSIRAEQGDVPSSNMPGNSRSMDLLDDFSMQLNQRPNEQAREFSSAKVGKETVYFQPIKKAQFATHELATASALWDADNENVVERNEQLLFASQLSSRTPRNSTNADSEDWHSLLTQTIAALETEQAPELPGKIRDRVRAAIQTRLLRLSAGDIEGALQPIKGLSREEQAFWHHQLVGLSTFLHSSFERIGDAALHPAAAEEALNSIRLAQKELAELAPLKIENVKLCRSVSGFGQYTVMKNELKPGDTAIVYCELRNFSTTLEAEPNNLKSQPKFTARLQGGFQIIAADDRVVAQHQYKTIVDRSENARTDFYMYFPITIPEIDDGEYRLNVSIADENANKRADLAQPLSIKVQAESPSKTAKTKETVESTRR